MPSLITHIAFFQKQFQKTNPKDLIEGSIGTVLPDIDFIGVANRSETHLKNKDVFSASFQAIADKFTHVNSPVEKEALYLGFLHHNLLDIKYGKAVYKPSRDKISILASRLLTDELFWDKIALLGSLLQRLQNVQGKDLLKNVSKKETERWFKIVRNYLAQKPNREIRINLSEEFGIDRDLMLQIEEKIKHFKADSLFQKEVFKIYSEGSVALFKDFK